MSSIALLRSLLLCMAVLPPLAAAQCPEQLDPVPPSSAYAEDWRLIERVYAEREPSRLPQVLQRLAALRQQPSTPPPASEQVALEIALLDAQATLEWISKRQAGVEVPEFEYDYRDQHPHRSLQRAMVLAALAADPGHRQLTQAAQKLSGLPPEFQLAQLELAVQRQPEDAGLRQQLIGRLIGENRPFENLRTHLLPLLYRARHCDSERSALLELAMSAMAVLEADRLACPALFSRFQDLASRIRASSREAMALPDTDGRWSASLGNYLLELEAERQRSILQSLDEALRREPCIAATDAPEIRARALLPHLLELEIVGCPSCRVQVEETDGAGRLLRLRAIELNIGGNVRHFLDAEPSQLRRLQVQALRYTDSTEDGLPSGWRYSVPVAIEVRTPESAETAPTAPLEFSAEAVDAYTTRLSWRAGAGLAYGFELRECYGDGEPHCMRAALIEAGLESFDYVHAAPGALRRFELRAFNQVGASPPLHASLRAPRDEGLDTLRAEWQQRQALRDGPPGPEVSWLIESGEAWYPDLEAPWKLIHLADSATDRLRLKGVDDWWRPIEQAGWAERCTTREELLAQPIDTFGMRLEFTARVRLPEDRAEVDLFRVADDDTQCDLDRCPGLIAFGPASEGACYAHRGWAGSVPRDSEPGLIVGWDRDGSQLGFVWSFSRGILIEFVGCEISEAELPTLRLPLNREDGRAVQSCQARPLAAIESESN